MRQYLHRMVVCMEKEILPFVPVVLENLLKQPDARELHDFLPLMNQMIMKFKVSCKTYMLIYRDINPTKKNLFIKVNI